MHFGFNYMQRAIILLILLSVHCSAVQNITFPDARIFVSPGACTTASGTMTCYAWGWYIKFQVTGTTSVKLTVDTTVNSGVASTGMPTVKTVAVAPLGTADTAYTTTQFPSNNTSGTQVTAIAGLTSGTSYTVTIYGLGGDGTLSTCYSGTVCETVIQSMQVDDGATVSAATLRAKRSVFFGDSLETAYFGGTVSGSEYTFVDWTWGYPFFLMAGLGAEGSVFGIGSQGYVNGGNGGYPAVGSSWNNYRSGISRTFSGIDYVFVAEGNNDHGQSAATITANVSSMITAMRAAFGSTTKIFVIPPLNPKPLGGDGSSGSIAADIAAGVSAAGDASTYMLTLPAEFQNTMFTTGLAHTWCSPLDGIHLNGGAQASLDGNCQGLIGYSVMAQVEHIISFVPPAPSTCPFIACGRGHRPLWLVAVR